MVVKDLSLQVIDRWLLVQFLHCDTDIGFRCLVSLVMAGHNVEGVLSQLVLQVAIVLRAGTLVALHSLRGA